MARRKMWGLALATIMAFTSLTACSSKNSEGPTAEPTATAEATATATAVATAAPDTKTEDIRNGTYKFDTPVTITTVKATDATMKYKNGETVENNIHTRWAKEQLGIDIKYLWQSPGEQFATKIRLMLTAHEQLPDVLTTMDIGLMNELIESGEYKDITEDFNTYASDKMKEIYSSHPLAWSQVTFGGKKMALPLFANAGNDNGVLWVRQDWLDELKLAAPTTFEELETVLQAFLDKKPGGTDNVIPLGVSMGAGGGNPNPLAGWLGESTWVFGPSGTVPYQWLVNDKGELEHGSTWPQMKEGLARLKSWYDKGFISKEAGLHDENKLAELIGQGRIGMVVAPHWMGGWPVPDLQKNVPGATMKPYALPTLNGKAAGRDTAFLKGGMLVRKDFEHTDALFLYLNRLFAGVGAEKGSEFEFGYAKDYDYTVKADGSVSVLEEDIPGGKVGVYKYFLFEAKDPFLAIKKLAKNSRLYRAGTLPEADKATFGNPDVALAAEIVEDGWAAGTYVQTEFMGATTPTMQSKGGILTKLEGETVIGIIHGRKSMDDFDKFVTQWKSIGGDQMTKEANEWYKAQK